MLEAKKEKLIMIALFAASFLLYFSIGFAVHKSPKFMQFDSSFAADTPRVVWDLSVFAGNHYRTEVHPLFVLFLNPIGSALSVALGYVVSAIFLTSVFGGINVSLLYLFLRKIKLKNFYSIFFSLLLGVSSSSLIYASMPQTFVFSSVGLIFLLLLTIDSGSDDKNFLSKFIPASIFAMGMATTNIVFPLILFIYKFYKLRARDFIKLFIIAFSAIIFISIALSIIQLSIYPSSKLFFTPGAYKEDTTSYFHFKSLVNPSEIVLSFYNSFLYNVIGPHPLTPAFTPEPLRITDLIYIVFLLFTAYLIVKNKIYLSPVFLSVASFFIFSFFFFQVYGGPKFLYSLIYTPFLVLMLAVPYKINFSRRADVIFKIFAVFMFIFILGSNIIFVRDFISIYLKL